MDAQHPIPLPVQPLAYETPQPSPWGRIVKVIATLALLQGCHSILAALFSLGPGRAWGGPGYLVAMCIQLASGASGAAMLVAAIM